MSLVTIQRSPTPDNDNFSSTIHLDDSLCNESESEDFFTSKETAVLQNVKGRRRSSIIREGNLMQCSLKRTVELLRKEDSLILIVNLEKINSKVKGNRYFCVILSSGKQDTEEHLLLGVDMFSRKATIGFVLPICQDMSVALDGDGGFKLKNKDGEMLFKPSSVMALWSTVHLLNKACRIAHDNNYYVGGLSHTWIGYYTSKILSNRGQIAEWNRMIDANAIENSNMAPKSAIGEFVIGTHIDQDIKMKDEIRMYLKEFMRDQDLDNVTVVTLRDKLTQYLTFDLKQYRSFITEEILIIYGQMDSASEILPYLYLGSVYNASNLEELSHNEITHIINVTRESENFFRDKFIYRNVQVFDVEETDLLYHFNDCYKFIVEAKSKNSACLVHCQRGISRSASVVIAYMMKEYDLTRDEAIQMVKIKRYCIKPNDGFMLQLTMYEGMLKARQSYLPHISENQNRSLSLRSVKRHKGMSITDLNRQYEYRSAGDCVIRYSPIQNERLVDKEYEHYKSDSVTVSTADIATKTMFNLSEIEKQKAIPNVKSVFVEVGDPNLNLQSNNFSKRLFRVKGDDSWIVPSLERSEGSSIQYEENLSGITDSETIANNENCSLFIRKAFNSNLDPNSMLMKADEEEDCDQQYTDSRSTDTEQ